MRVEKITGMKNVVFFILFNFFYVTERLCNQPNVNTQWEKMKNQ